MKNIEKNMGITCIPQKHAMCGFPVFIQAACWWQRTYTIKTLLMGEHSFIMTNEAVAEMSSGLLILKIIVIK